MVSAPRASLRHPSLVALQDPRMTWWQNTRPPACTPPPPIFIDPLDQSATSTQAFPFFRVGVPPSPSPLWDPRSAHVTLKGPL